MNHLTDPGPIRTAGSIGVFPTKPQPPVFCGVCKLVIDEPDRTQRVHDGQCRRTHEAEYQAKYRDRLQRRAAMISTGGVA